MLIQRCLFGTPLKFTYSAHGSSGFTVQCLLCGAYTTRTSAFRIDTWVEQHRTRCL